MKKLISTKIVRDSVEMEDVTSMMDKKGWKRTAVVLSKKYRGWILYFVKG